MAIGLYNLLQFITVGIAAGFMGGFFGVGAAIIIVPLLIFWVFPALQVSPEVIAHLSIGTSLAIIIPTSLSSSLAHSKAGNVTWRVVFYLVITGLVAAYLGSGLATKLSGPLLKALFGIFLVIMASQMYFQEKRNGESSDVVSPAPIPTLVLGFLVGIFSGFFGVGGGVLAIPLLVRFMGVSIHRAVGISISFAFFASLVGTWGYIVNGWGKSYLPSCSLGYVHIGGWILAGLPSIIFAQWGTKLGRKTKPFYLQRAFAFFLAIVGFRMLWDYLRLILPA